MNVVGVAGMLRRHRERPEEETAELGPAGASRAGLIDQVGDPESARKSPSGHDGEHRQRHERVGHHRRRLVGMFMDMMIARLPGKRHEPEPEHIESRQHRAAGNGIEEDRVRRILAGKEERLGEDRVLRVVATQADVEKRHAGTDDRQAADEHRSRGPRHHLGQPPHLPHVVGMTGVDHRSRTEKQEALEEGMGDEMKQPGQPSPDAERQHHVAELTDGRIGKYAFDVVGHQRDRGGDEQSDRPDIRDDEEGIRSQDRIETADEIDTRGDHRRRVDERRDGRRTLHGVGKPDEEWKLSALPDAPAEDAEPGHEEQPAAVSLIPPILDLGLDLFDPGPRILRMRAQHRSNLLRRSELHHPVGHPLGMPRHRRTNQRKQPRTGMAVEPG